MSLSFKQYADLSSRTASKTLSHEQSLCNFALGLCGEVYELCVEMTTQALSGHRDNAVEHLVNVGFTEVYKNPSDKVIKELGDCYWYLSQLFRELYVNFDNAQLIEENKLLIFDPGAVFVAVGAICEQVKKIVFHNKSPDIQLLDNQLYILRARFDNLCKMMKLEPSEVWQMNINKLKE